jgi:hypothetical protein
MQIEEDSSVLIPMVSSSSIFSTLSTLTLSIFSCKIIKKIYNSNTRTALLATDKCEVKYKPQHAAHNQPSIAQKITNT